MDSKRKGQVDSRRALPPWTGWRGRRASCARICPIGLSSTRRAGRSRRAGAAARRSRGAARGRSRAGSARAERAAERCAGAPGARDQRDGRRAAHQPRPRAARRRRRGGAVARGRRAATPTSSSTSARAARGDRARGGRRACSWLLSGAEAALAVNNNAAALLLALGTLARGREVIVSRGELVEIGGSFRVPEILERAGVRLVEVGTTNRTHLADYERALGPRTALLLKVHRSNFELRGFVAEVGAARAGGARRARAASRVVEDLGSGTLVDLTRARACRRRRTRRRACGSAPTSSASRATSCSAVRRRGSCSGGARHVEALRRDPVARALRLDKLSLAALDWTLGAARGPRPSARSRCCASSSSPRAAPRGRARALAERLAQAAARRLEVRVRERTPVGGGSLPGLELASWAVALRGPRRPRNLRPACAAPRCRCSRGCATERASLDVRTLLPGRRERGRARRRRRLRGAAALIAARPSRTIWHPSVPC